MPVMHLDLDKPPIRLIVVACLPFPLATEGVHHDLNVENLLEHCLTLENNVHLEQ